MIKKHLLKQLVTVVSIILLMNAYAFIKTEAASIRSPFYKNPQRSSHLYVINLDTITPQERTMLTTLQGVVSTVTKAQIYTVSKAEPDYYLWLKDLSANYGISFETIESPYKLLDIFKSYIDGYVLYSSKKPTDPSINNACSLAALKHCIAVDETLEAKVRSLGIKKLIGDCRNTDQAWAYENLWNYGLNHSMVVELSPDKAASLRDYAVMAKALVFYEEDVKNTTLREKIFNSLEDNAVCLGWGPDEFINVSTASKYGVSVVAADWSYNLTVLSAFPSLHLSQKSTAAPISEKDVHYVTFIMSDGDNQQWLLGSNFNSQNWYGCSCRGSFNMGWTISPSLYYLSPTVLNLYYKNAKTGVNNDYFVTSPSGLGYMYPSKFPPDRLKSFTVMLNDYAEKVSQHYTAVIDDGSFYDLNLWSKYTSKPNIKGLFYLDYHRHDNYRGEILWSNDKPVVSCRDLLWSGLEDETALVQNINNRIKAGQTDVTSPTAYTFIYVHAWSKSLSDIEKAADELRKNSKVRIVTPEEFMLQIKKNIKKRH